MSTRTWFGALVPIAVLVAVVATFTVGPLGSAPVGGTPRPSPLAPTLAPESSSPVTATPTPTLPSPTPPTVDLGASGDWVLVAVADDGTIHVRTTGQNGEQTLYETDAPWPNEPTGDHVAVSVDGHLAIEVDVESASSATSHGTWLVDMRRPRDPGRLLPGGRPAFGPSGDLVTFVEDPTTATWDIRRYTFLRDGEIDSGSALSEPSGVGVGVVPIFAADGSGLFATQLVSDTAVPAVLHWDGTVVDRRSADLPWFATGVERAFGAAGESVSEGCDASVGNGGSGCAIRWSYPDGTEHFTPLANDIDLRQPTWDRAGKVVVFMSGDGRRMGLYAIDTADRDSFTKLATLPGEDVRITGITDDAAIVALESGESIAVALDGSGTFGGRHDGNLALVVP